MDEMGTLPPYPSMTCAEIISKFETYVDDTTELSTAQELALLNKIYQRVCDDRPWEFLKKEASGTMASTTTIAVPSDFGYFVENLNYTDNAQNTQYNFKPTGILINGTKWLRIINWSDRRQYVNKDGFAYYDARLGTLTTTYAQPSSATYSFDYKAVPATLIISDTPVFPARYHDILVHGMAVDDMIIQIFNKNQAYTQEHQAMYSSYLAQMALWNANLQSM